MGPWNADVTIGIRPLRSPRHFFAELHCAPCAAHGGHPGFQRFQRGKMGVFQLMGVPQVRWMVFIVYSGKPQIDIDDEQGYPLFRETFICLLLRLEQYSWIQTTMTPFICTSLPVTTRMHGISDLIWPDCLDFVFQDSRLQRNHICPLHAK